MSDDLVERVCLAMETCDNPYSYEHMAIAAIAVVREEVIEECAGVAEGSFPFDIEIWMNSTKKEMTAHTGNAIAAAIRALKETKP